MTSRSPLRARVVLLAVLPVLLLGATACGGDDDASEAVASAQAHASEVARNSGSEGVTASEAAAAATVDTTKVCRDIRAAVRAVPGGDPIATQARLVGVLSGLFAPGGALAGQNGAALDGITAKACPKVKAEALEQAGITSFGKI